MDSPKETRKRYRTRVWIGVDPVTAQHLLGHSDYETTANIYTHIVEEDFMEADALMQKSLAGLFDD